MSVNSDYKNYMINVTIFTKQYLKVEEIDAEG